MYSYTYTRVRVGVRVRARVRVSVSMDMHMSPHSSAPACLPRLPPLTPIHEAWLCIRSISSCIREQALTFSGQWEIEDMQGVAAENTAYNVGVCTCHFTRKWKNLAGVPCSEAP